MFGYNRMSDNIMLTNSIKATTVLVRLVYEYETGIVTVRRIRMSSCRQRTNIRYKIQET